MANTDQNNEQNREYIYVVIPAKTSKDKGSIRRFEYKDKKTGKNRKLMDVTLPYGTIHDGMDLSYYHFVVYPSAVDSDGQRYEGSHSVRFPKQNAQGRPWTVNLKRDFGGRDEITGEWIPDVREYKITAEDLKTVCREQYDHYKEYRSQNNAGQER